LNYRDIFRHASEDTEWRPIRSGPELTDCMDEHRFQAEPPPGMSTHQILGLDHSMILSKYLKSLPGGREQSLHCDLGLTEELFQEICARFDFTKTYDEVSDVLRKCSILILAQQDSYLRIGETSQIITIREGEFLSFPGLMPHCGGRYGSCNIRYYSIFYPNPLPDWVRDVVRFLAEFTHPPIDPITVERGVLVPSPTLSLIKNVAYSVPSNTKPVPSGNSLSSRVTRKRRTKSEKRKCKGGGSRHPSKRLTPAQNLQ